MERVHADESAVRGVAVGAVGRVAVATVGAVGVATIGAVGVATVGAVRVATVVVSVASPSVPSASPVVPLPPAAGGLDLVVAQGLVGSLGHLLLLVDGRRRLAPYPCPCPILPNAIRDVDPRVRR